MADVLEVQNGAAPEKVAAPATAASFTGMKPQLLVEAPKATDAVQFYKTAFGAVEIGRSTETKRKAEQELPLISCAQLEIAGSTFLVSDLSDDSSAYVSCTLKFFMFSFCFPTRSSFILRVLLLSVVASSCSLNIYVLESERCCLTVLFFFFFDFKICVNAYVNTILTVYLAIFL